MPELEHYEYVTVKAKIPDVIKEWIEGAYKRTEGIDMTLEEFTGFTLLQGVLECNNRGRLEMYKSKHGQN
jgi:hypothetical protein